MSEEKIGNRRTSTEDWVRKTEEILRYTTLDVSTSNRFEQERADSLEEYDELTWILKPEARQLIIQVKLIKAKPDRKKAERYF